MKGQNKLIKYTMAINPLLIKKLAFCGLLAHFSTLLFFLVTKKEEVS